MLSRERLEQLAAKYEAMAELRRNPGQPEASAREPLRRLSKLFPGSLREIDILSLERIEARAQSLSRAASGAAPLELWMQCVDAYHRLMECCLWLKPQVRRRSFEAAQLSDAERQAAFGLCEEAERLFGVQCTLSLLGQVARPPAGRLNQVVFEELGRRFEREPRELKVLIFPGDNRVC